MKKWIIVFFLVVVHLSAFSAETVEQRLVKLEQIVKAQSDSISTYKSMAAEVEKQKSFLGDIYSTNVGWASLILSIMVAGVFGLTVYNVFDNSLKEEKMKNEFNRKILFLRRNIKSAIFKSINHKIDTIELRFNKSVEELTEKSEENFKTIIKDNIEEFNAKTKELEDDIILSIGNIYDSEFVMNQGFIINATESRDSKQIIYWIISLLSTCSKSMIYSTDKNNNYLINNAESKYSNALTTSFHALVNIDTKNIDIQTKKALLLFLESIKPINNKYESKFNELTLTLRTLLS